jgi:hypothetical protein
MTDRFDALADRLAEHVSERVVERIVELLDERNAGPSLLDATQAARLLGVSRATVYSRADELGAIRIGEGPRPRLRFERRFLAEYLAERIAGDGRR